MGDVKRLKDPVYGYINIPSDYAINIIDTAAFQRLRRITQTSYAPLYASAQHNRFTHSLGVFHLGDIACTTVVGELNKKFGDVIERLGVDLNHIRGIFLLACLLHDIGHAPFSHTGEEFYLDQLEKHRYDSIHRQLKEVVNSSSFSEDVPKSDIGAAAPHEIMSAITGIQSFPTYFATAEDREFFARCITGYHYSQKDTTCSLYNCFVSLLNSKVIDVDRLDYLIRDSFFTGFDTVGIDYERLLTSLTLVLLESDNDESPRFELAYRKGAISVIENVVYAHDAERKWIQTHPVVLYDIYILRHIMSKLDNELSTEEEKLFSSNAISKKGVSLRNGTCVKLLCDDDIISFIKNGDEDSLSAEYFSRADRRRPLWKSEPEYTAFMRHDVTGGQILSNIEKALQETETYLTKSSDDWTINEATVSKVKAELQKAEEKDEHTPKEQSSEKKSIMAQIRAKKHVLAVMECLQEFSKQNNLPQFNCVILSASQFSSGFNKPDVSNINLVFNDRQEERIKKLNEVLSTLNGDEKKRDKFFYFYFYRNKEQVGERGSSDLKAALSQALVQAFIRIT